MFKVTFTTSKSKLFKKAISVAKKLNYKIDDGKYVVELSLLEVFNKWEHINLLLHIVDKWKSFEISLDNIICTTNKDYRTLFYAVQEIKNCYNNKKRDCIDCNKEYELGCWRLKCITINPTYYSYKYWYKFGHFLDETTWIINKDELIAYLETEIKRNYTYLCPNFSLDKAKQIIETLPGHINAGNLEKWEILYRNEFTSDGIVKVPYSIEHIEPKEEKEASPNIYNEFKAGDIKNINRIDPEDLQDLWWRLPKQKGLTEEEKTDLLIDEYLRRKKE